MLPTVQTLLLQFMKKLHSKIQFQDFQQNKNLQESKEHAIKSNKPLLKPTHNATETTKSDFHNYKLQLT